MMPILVDVIDYAFAVDVDMAEEGRCKEDVDASGYSPSPEPIDDHLLLLR